MKRARYENAILAIVHRRAMRGRRPLTDNEIAAQVGCSTARVHQVRKKHNIVSGYAAHILAAARRARIDLTSAMSEQRSGA